jgi:hypothetical protein
LNRTLLIGSGVMVRIGLNPNVVERRKIIAYFELSCDALGANEIYGPASAHVFRIVIGTRKM